MSKQQLSQREQITSLKQKLIKNFHYMLDSLEPEEISSANYGIMMKLVMEHDITEEEYDKMAEQVLSSDVNEFDEKDIEDLRKELRIV